MTSDSQTSEWARAWPLSRPASTVASRRSTGWACGWECGSKVMAASPSHRAPGRSARCPSGSGPRRCRPAGRPASRCTGRSRRPTPASSAIACRELRVELGLGEDRLRARALDRVDERGDLAGRRVLAGHADDGADDLEAVGARAKYGNASWKLDELAVRSAGSSRPAREPSCRARRAARVGLAAARNVSASCVGSATADGLGRSARAYGRAFVTSSHRCGLARRAVRRRRRTSTPGRSSASRTTGHVRRGRLDDRLEPVVEAEAVHHDEVGLAERGHVARRRVERLHDAALRDDARDARRSGRRPARRGRRGRSSSRRPRSASGVRRRASPDGEQAGEHAAAATRARGRPGRRPARRITTPAPRPRTPGSARTAPAGGCRRGSRSAARSRGRCRGSRRRRSRSSGRSSRRRRGGDGPGRSRRRRGRRSAGRSARRRSAPRTRRAPGRPSPGRCRCRRARASASRSAAVNGPSRSAISVATVRRASVRRRPAVSSATRSGSGLPIGSATILGLN